MPSQTVLPRWRGFNLLYFYTLESDRRVIEDDFRFMTEHGFDFARLPMSYLVWTVDNDPSRIYEPALGGVDRVVELGGKHGIHVCLNFHRAPGYCINPGHTEPFDLWKDEEAQEAFCSHWKLFARRYRGISSEQLSFDLVNEPPGLGSGGMTREDHTRVIQAAVEAIRSVDPERQIIIDGISGGNLACPELAGLDVAQSCRAYLPMGISHYRAPWVRGSADFPPPAWPGGFQNGGSWSREDMEAHYNQWIDLAASGVGVHCGEGGCFKYTPHAVFLRWFEEVLDILTAHNIGWALWNLRGAFGVMDSERADVAYGSWRGHALDRKLLELLKRY